MPSMAQAKDLLVGTRVLICCITMNVLTEHPSYAILYSTIGASMAFLASRTKPASFRHLPIRFTVQGLGVLISTIGVSLHLSSLHLQPFPSHPTVHRGCVLIAGVTFAYAGHVSFSDTFLKSRDSADLPRTLASVQTCEVIMYKVSAITTHFFVGDDISSPAFISVGRLFRHISIACGVPVPIVYEVAVYKYLNMLKLVFLDPETDDCVLGQSDLTCGDLGHLRD
ncbi:hypothetical protein N7466_003429, partial [Penicillium verhagenii]|uniref:uncharacterized protein n=1 Tax=Penicillium verhagenii TaxID=1562060 RepID=UPI00254549D7